VDERADERLAERVVLVVIVVCAAGVLATVVAAPDPGGLASGLLLALAAVGVLGVGSAWLRVVAGARAPGDPDGAPAGGLADPTMASQGDDPAADGPAADDGPDVKGSPDRPSED
jgi:cation transporter-like permease